MKVMEGLGVAFFATGPGLGLIMYILTTLEFSTHYFDFHLLTTSVNAIYYYSLFIDPLHMTTKLLLWRITTKFGATSNNANNQ